MWAVICIVLASIIFGLVYMLGISILKENASDSNIFSSLRSNSSELSNLRNSTTEERRQARMSETFNRSVDDDTRSRVDDLLRNLSSLGDSVSTAGSTIPGSTVPVERDIAVEPVEEIPDRNFDAIEDLEL